MVLTSYNRADSKLTSRKLAVKTDSVQSECQVNGEPILIKKFGQEFFEAVALLVEQHTGVQIFLNILEDLRESFVAQYFPPLGHQLIDTLYLRPDIDPKGRAQEIFERMKMTNELEEYTDKDTKETRKRTSPLMVQEVIRNCFEGPYHSSLLIDLTVIEDWYGRFWITKSKPIPEDERKIAEKLSRSLVDMRRLLAEWKSTDWEQEKQHITTGQYL